VDIFDVSSGEEEEREEEEEKDDDTCWHVISLRQVMGEHHTKEEERRIKEKQLLFKRLDVCGVYATYSALFGHDQFHDINFAKMEELRHKRELYHNQINSKLPRSDSCGPLLTARGGLGEGGESDKPFRRASLGCASFQSNRSNSCWDRPPILLRQASLKNKTVAASLKVRKNSALVTGSFSASDDSAKDLKYKDDKEDEGHEVHPLMFELDQVFLMENRFLFKLMIELYQILNALFVALWLTNFSFIAVESHHPFAYTGLIIVGILIMFYMLSFIQFHATCLLAVTSLKNEATEWICEQDIMKSEILPRLRDELMKLFDDKNFIQEIEMIFDLVKDDDTDGISVKQFHNALQTLNLYFTHDEVSCLFRVVDTNGSGVIELTEFKELLRSNSSLISRAKENNETTLDGATPLKRKKEREKRISGTLHVTLIGSITLPD
jgi:hypothetical protein